jgi:hypothetical protein
MTRQRVVIGVLISLVLISSTGCLGQFALTRQARDFNLNVTDSKWGREGVFLVMVIIPVYGFCLFLDGLIFNSIEFWGGTNPLNNEQALLATSGEGSATDAEGRSMTWSARDDGTIDVTITEPTGEVRTYHTVPAPTGGDTAGGGENVLRLVALSP